MNPSPDSIATHSIEKTDMNPESPKYIPLPLRWAARILSLFSLSLLTLFMVGEHFNFFALEPRERLLAVFFPLGVIAGLLLAWRWEAVGGVLSLLCLASFYVVHWFGSGRFPTGWAFAALTVPGLLFLLTAVASARTAARTNS